MALTTRSSVLSFGTFQEHQKYHNGPFSSISFTTATASESSSPYEQSTISRRGSVSTMESFGYQQTISTYNPHSRSASMSLLSRSSTININSKVGQLVGGGSVDLRKQAAQKLAQKQQQQLRKQQQKKLKDQQKKAALPLFPTERTRGAIGPGALQPVDITKIDLMPIEVSRTIIMSCIDEIKLRGLKHKYLFRNAFYSPSVEASLQLLKNPKKRDLFSIKALRIDTVGGLLTTVLSRTYPPLIPHEIQEIFENPNGRFFFELLGLLPELNRFIFVEILDLCCELADRQSENHVSHSKLAIYPGSCCFGLEEYMPTWDTRYLMTPDLKKFSKVFYYIIYAYREERDLSAEELQKKLDHREKVMAEERLEMLEREHGLEGAQIILRMEARVAQGLPAESPPLPVVPTSPSDLKEVSLYAGRKEKVVADDAISVLEMEIDQDVNTSNISANGSTTDVSGNGRTQDSGTEGDENEEEDVEKVMADLRKSVSVATLGYWPDNNSRSTSSLNATTTVSAASSTSTISLPQQHSYTHYSDTTYTTINTPAKTAAATATRPRPTHTKSLARFGSIAQNQFPVSPGDIFGISRHAIEQRELQQFLAVARTFKPRKSFGTKSGGNISSKRISQWRLQNIRLRPLSPSRSPSRSPAFGAAHLVAGSAPLFVLRRAPQQHSAALLLPTANSSSSHSRAVSAVSSPTTTPTSVLVSATKSRRGRTRQFRKELEVYLSQGLTKEEAIQQRQQDKRRRKRAAKRAKLAAAREAQAAVERERALEQAREQERMKVMTMEETEVLEAFDYLTDAEFGEFMALAGLTLADVERIREKAAIAALEQVTEDIQATDRVQAATAAAAAAAEKKEAAEIVVVVESLTVETDETKEQDFAVVDADIAQQPVQTKAEVVTADVKETPEEPESESAAAATIPAHAASAFVAPIDRQRKRPISPQHMTSMELLIKNTAVIGDSNLRCYPILPATPSASDIAASAVISPAAAAVSGGLLSQASTVMTALPAQTAVNEEEEVVEITSRDMGMPDNRSLVSLLITKGIPHLENHLSSSSSASTTSSSSSFGSAASDDEDNYEGSFEDSSNDDDQEDNGECVATTTATISTTTVTTTTSGNVQIFEFETVVEESDPHPSNNAMYDSDGDELEILDINQNNNTNTNTHHPFHGMDKEEAAELLELLESMTPEERCEFLRLSHQDDDNNNAGYLTSSAIVTA